MAEWTHGERGERQEERTVSGGNSGLARGLDCYS